MSASTPRPADTAMIAPDPSADAMASAPDVPAPDSSSPVGTHGPAPSDTGMHAARMDGSELGVPEQDDPVTVARPDAADALRVLLYSSDRTVREQVHFALGRRIAGDLPPVEIFDTATQPAVMSALAGGGFDVVVLDGEATPSGGFGIAHQMKDEIVNCPPVVLLVARRDDAWLATWSRAEGVSSYPVDPLRLPRTVAEVVRATRWGDSSRVAGGTVTA